MDILDKERLKECRLKLGITKQEAAKRIQISQPAGICDTRPVHVTLLYRLFLKWLKFFQHLQIILLENLQIQVRID